MSNCITYHVVYNVRVGLCIKFDVCAIDALKYEHNVSKYGRLWHLLGGEISFVCS